MIRSGESILAPEFVETVLTAAKENLNRDGYLSPVLFLHLEGGGRVMFSLRLPETPEEKQAYFAGIGLATYQAGQRIQEAVFVSEAWYVDVSEEGTVPDIAPSQHPKRREAITIVGRNADKSRISFVIQPFSRDSQNQPLWEEMPLARYNVATDEDVHPVGLIDYLFG